MARRRSERYFRLLSIDKSSMAEPSVTEPFMDEPSKSSMDEPSKSSMDESSESSMDEPSKSSMAEPLISSMAESSMARPSMARPSMARPSMARPSMARQSMARPSMARQSMVRPSMAKPSPPPSDQEILLARLKSLPLAEISYDKLDKSAAQKLLDSFQKLLDWNELDPHFRTNLVVAMQKISGSNRLLPACYELKDVKIDFHSRVSADVYRGTFQGRVVCIKDTLHPKYMEEVVLTRQLSHPNIQTIYGIFCSDSKIFVISPWMENGDLDTYLKHNLDAPRLLLINDMANGLLYLHKNHIVHGNLRNTNILIDNAGRAHLAGFGTSASHLSTTMQEFNTNSTEWNALKQLNDDNELLDTASDVYAYWCICYKIFTSKGHDTEQGLMIVPPKHFMHLQTSSLYQRAWGLTREIWSFIDHFWSSSQINQPSSAEIVRFLKPLVPDDTRPLFAVDKFSSVEFRCQISELVQFINVEELDCILHKVMEWTHNSTKHVDFDEWFLKHSKRALQKLDHEEFTQIMKDLETSSSSSSHLFMELMNEFSSLHTSGSHHTQSNLTDEPLVNSGNNMFDMLSAEAQASIMTEDNSLKIPIFYDTVNNAQSHVVDITSLAQQKLVSSLAEDNPWKISTSYETANHAQSHAEGIMPLVCQRLTDANYTGTFCLHSGFNIDTIDLSEPKQEIYIILDQDIQDELCISLVDLAQPFAGVVVTPHQHWPLDSNEIVFDEESELIDSNHGISVNCLQEQNQSMVKSKETGDSSGYRNTDKNESDSGSKSQDERDGVEKKGSGSVNINANEGIGDSNGDISGRNESNRKSHGTRDGSENGGGGGGGGVGESGGGGDGSGSGSGGGSDDGGSGGRGRGRSENENRSGDRDGNSDSGSSGGGGGDPDGRNGGGKQDIANSKAVQISFSSTLESQDGKEQFDITCNFKAAFIKGHPIYWLKGWLLEVNMNRLLVASMSSHYILSHCQMRISASHTMNIPYWSPGIEHACETSKIQQSNTRTGDISGEISMSPSLHVGRTSSSTEATESIQHTWEIMSHLFKPASLPSEKGVLWTYKYNISTGSAKKGEEFTQRPTIFFAPLISSLPTSSPMTLRVELVAFWKFNLRKTLIQCLRQKSTLLPAQLNLLHRVSVEVDLHKLKEEDVQHFGENIVDKLPALLKDGDHALFDDYKLDAQSGASLSSVHEVVIKQAVVGIVKGKTLKDGLNVLSSSSNTNTADKVNMIREDASISASSQEFASENVDMLPKIEQKHSNPFLWSRYKN